MVVVLGIGVVLALAALLAGGRLADAGSTPGAPTGGTGAAVELPARDLLGSNAPGSTTGDTRGGSGVSSVVPSQFDRPVTCRPAGCARWRADVGPGTVVPMGDRLIHIGADGLTAVAIDDGTVLWTEPVDGTTQRVQPVRVVGDPALVIAVGSSTIESRDPADGRVRWRVSLPGRAYLGAADGDTMLVFGGSLEVRHSTTGSASGGPGFIASLDRRTGEPRWLRTDLDLLDLDPGSPLVRFPGDVLAALDPATGASRWRRAYSPAPGGASRFAQGRAGVVVADGGGITILDRTTGEVTRQVAVATGRDVWLRLIGDALLVGRPVQPTPSSAAGPLDPMDVDVINLSDRQAPIRTYPGVVDLRLLTDGMLPADPLVGIGPVTADQAVTGLVLAALDPVALVLHRLDTAGEPVWRRHIVRERPAGQAPACCWRLAPDVAPDRFLAVPPATAPDPVRLLADTGEIIDRFDRPDGLAVETQELWYGRTVLVGPFHEEGQAVTVAGPSGRAEVPSDARPVLLDPVVFQTTSGLLAIDPDVLGVRR